MTAVNAPLSPQEFEPRTPDDEEVVVAIAGCGVCHTDLGYLYDGVRTNHPLPLTLGHEISGRVVETGSGCGDFEGAAVVVPAVIPCGVCDLCRRGLGNICRAQKMPGNDIEGGFATHITVPAYGLCRVDENRLGEAGLELADVSVLADAVTTPYQAAVLANVQPGDFAVVIGVGGVGGYAVQLANAMGATVAALDVDDGKLEQVSAHGAALTINPVTVDSRELKRELREFASSRGLRDTEWKIFECSGTTAGQDTAYSLLTFGAHMAVVGFTMEKTSVRLSNLMAFNARLQGNWGCLPEHYPAALELVLSGKVHMKPFVRHHPLDEINEVFAAAHRHELTERAILVPGT
ncbi:MAG: 6-hydroxycyclohex-1-ene-1-carbonyl-CoA dehydrogenase [Proteobacteria bacterium]|nr:MAG: 6-hydroxycyclohex-1-ene-1-carbonyl-CoA dehydrogenase [Pseudomonadota bacterium]